VGFVCVAFLATVARWVLVSRVLGWGLGEVARPFFSVAPLAAVSMVSGAVVLHVAPGQPLAAMCAAGSVTVGVYVVLLRVLARGIVDDALGILPLPDRYAVRVGRLLGLGRPRPA
jgi:hypothetical protein